MSYQHLDMNHYKRKNSHSFFLFVIALQNRLILFQNSGNELWRIKLQTTKTVKLLTQYL